MLKIWAEHYSSTVSSEARFSFALLNASINASFCVSPSSMKKSLLSQVWILASHNQEEKSLDDLWKDLKDEIELKYGVDFSGGTFDWRDVLFIVSTLLHAEIDNVC